MVACVAHMSAQQPCWYKASSACTGREIRETHAAAAAEREVAALVKGPSSTIWYKQPIRLSQMHGFKTM